MRRSDKSCGILLLPLAVAGLLLVGCGLEDSPGEFSLLLSGIVTDAETGKPVPGVRVADNIYCGSPSRPCQEAWTDEEGRYELNTWYEHHSLVVSGPEYPPKIKSIMTKTFGHEPKMQMNISISKSPPVPASDTNVRIVGKVTDEKTGEPLVGARVADNIYAGAPDKTCQEAWTDEEGRYVLNTWYEEHSLVVSAPGYPPKLVGFATKILSHEPEVEMDVSIVKGVN